MRLYAVLLVGLLLMVSVAPTVSAHVENTDEDCPNDGNHVHAGGPLFLGTCVAVDDTQKICVGNICIVINE